MSYSCSYIFDNFGIIVFRYNGLFANADSADQ